MGLDFDGQADAFDDNAMVIEYFEAMQNALGKLRASGPLIVLMDHVQVSVEKLLGCNFEKLILLGMFLGRKIALKLRHVRDDDWDLLPTKADALQTMQLRCDAESAKLHRLRGSAHWVQPIACNTTVLVGGANYPCMCLEFVAGRDLSEAISKDGSGGNRRPSAAMLVQDFNLVKTVVVGIASAMWEAHRAGLCFDKSGNSGPMISDVMLYTSAEGQYPRTGIKLVDCEHLIEVDPDSRFSLQPLAHSSTGLWLRSWWRSTAHKLGIGPSRRCRDAVCANIVSKYACLDWLMQDWPSERLVDGYSLLQSMLKE
eukprot:CAMPEP_0119326740 /NCGR_PEP_ID=MMETSP1333-20130426/69148_1 /TAXON_ID=418940 /ORGANISM="Scyphosphaera apsteinii, Strain RCC1455" /LENGTH=312 /DNA_ID=CAMNT_0007335131 /DNA_START=429 /DNA_END=1367 /DNA_ORIENTATION=+